MLSLACGGGRPMEAAPFSGPHRATIVDVDAGEGLLATVGEDRVAHVWTLPDLEGVRTIPLEDFGTAVALEPGSGRLAVADRSGRVTVWDTGSWIRVGRLDHGATSLAWRAGVLVLGEAVPGGAAIYDARLETVTIIEGHAGPVVDVDISPDGRWVATASADRTVRLWDVASGEERQLYAGHRAGVVAVRFGPEGRVLATGSQDKTARLWDVESGEPLRQLGGHRDWVVALAFPPGRRGLVVTADRDGRYRVWTGADGGLRSKGELALDGGDGDGDVILEDMLFLGDRLILVGSTLWEEALEKALSADGPPYGEPRVLDARCARLLACGKALMRARDRSLAEPGLEAVKAAREMDLVQPATCLNTLVALPATLGGEVPADCAP